MGRDARALGVFGRWARFPFLDEYLLRFVCGAVPFEHVVQPGCDLLGQAEAVMRRLQRAAADQEHPTVQAAACGNPAHQSYHREGPEEWRVKGRQPAPQSCALACGENDGTEEASSVCCGNKWLLRLCAAHCGLPFSAVAKKRAVQFGTRSAKVSNREWFPSNRKARGDAILAGGDDNL